MYWYSAYIRSQSEKDIYEDIKRTDFGGVKVGVVHSEDFNGHFCDAAMSWRLIILSPIVNGWMGMWGSTTKLQESIFRENKYTGLLFEVEDDKDYNQWCYQVWENGLRLDWFISDPIAYFQAWLEKSLQEGVLPYVTSRIKKQITTNEFYDLLKRPHNLFPGDVNLLKQKHYLKYNTPGLKGNIANSFNPAAKGIVDFLSSTVVPYASMEYDPVDLGIYLDVEKGREDLSKWPDYVDSYLRIKSLQDIDKFTFLVLDVKSRDEGNVFYV